MLNSASNQPSPFDPLEGRIQLEMLSDGEVVEEDVVLRADAKVSSKIVLVFENIDSIF